MKKRNMFIQKKTKKMTISTVQPSPSSRGNLNKPLHE